jgi:hypothetical protein
MGAKTSEDDQSGGNGTKTSYLWVYLMNAHMCQVKDHSLPKPHPQVESHAVCISPVMETGTWAAKGATTTMMTLTMPPPYR